MIFQVELKVIFLVFIAVIGEHQTEAEESENTSVTLETEDSAKITGTDNVTNSSDEFTNNSNQEPTNVSGSIHGNETLSELEINKLVDIAKELIVSGDKESSSAQADGKKGDAKSNIHGNDSLSESEINKLVEVAKELILFGDSGKNGSLQIQVTEKPRRKWSSKNYIKPTKAITGNKVQKNVTGETKLNDNQTVVPTTEHTEKPAEIPREVENTPSKQVENIPVKSKPKSAPVKKPKQVQPKKANKPITGKKASSTKPYKAPAKPTKINKPIKSQPSNKPKQPQKSPPTKPRVNQNKAKG